MSGLRHQLAFLLRGHADVQRDLAALGTDLRDLQQKVAGIDERLWALQRALDDARQDHLDGIDALRTAVADATDDLAARYEALSRRLER